MISHCLRQGWEQKIQNVAFHAFGARSYLAYDVIDTYGQMLSLRCESVVSFFCQRKQALEGNSLISSPSECFSLPNPEILIEPYRFFHFSFHQFS